MRKGSFRKLSFFPFVFLCLFLAFINSRLHFCPHSEIILHQSAVLPSLQSIEWTRIAKVLARLKTVLRRRHDITEGAVGSLRDRVRGAPDRAAEAASEHSNGIQQVLQILDPNADSLINELLSELPRVESYYDLQVEKLSSRVSAELFRRQFYVNCSDPNLKFLSCNLNKECGFACEVHHSLHCMNAAIATNRVLVLQVAPWKYGSWGSLFQVPGRCTVENGHAPPFVPVQPNDGTPPLAEPWHVRNVFIPIVDEYKTAYEPPNMPPDVFQVLDEFHKNPDVWWVGHMANFLLRPVPEFADYLDAVKSANDWSHPIVGVHVRRTDKVGHEAARHELAEYMAHVELFFDKEIASGRLDAAANRTVYLATDEIVVIEEAEQRWLKYRFITNKKAAAMAGLTLRYSDESAKGIAQDVFLLSDTDFVVCTFSSQVCRLAYELMQTRHRDPSANFVSLDDGYYYGGGLSWDFCVIIARKGHTNDELDVEVGDMITEHSSVDSFWVRGRSVRLHRQGLVPRTCLNRCPRPNFPPLFSNASSDPVPPPPPLQIS